jgi:integrase
MSKTKYKGVYYDEKHNSYYVNTTFKTKDGYSIKKCKRGFSTAKKANDWKLEFTVEAKNSTTINNKGRLTSILINYIEYRRNNMKPSSLKTLKNTLENHFIPNMPENIKDFKTQDILNLYHYVSNLKNKPRGKNHIISSFNNFIEWLDLTERISPSFAKKYKFVFVKFNVNEEPKSSYITLENYKAFLNTFDDAKNNHIMYKLLFNVLFFTGCRFGEVLALKFSKIDFDNSIITFDSQVTNISRLENIPYNAVVIGNNIEVPYTKTNSIKRVTIPRWLLNDLLLYRKKHETEYVFEYNSNIIDRATVRDVFKRHLVKAGLPEIRIHDLRHSHTTMLYDSGCDSKYVAERLGHSSEKTSLEVYKHLTKDKKQINDSIVENFSL